MADLWKAHALVLCHPLWSDRYLCSCFLLDRETRNREKDEEEERVRGRSPDEGVEIRFGLVETRDNHQVLHTKSVNLGGE